MGTFLIVSGTELDVSHHSLQPGRNLWYRYVVNGHPSDAEFKRIETWALKSIPYI